MFAGHLVAACCNHCHQLLLEPLQQSEPLLLLLLLTARLRVPC
jgi:hypothetical protein